MRWCYKVTDTTKSTQFPPADHKNNGKCLCPQFKERYFIEITKTLRALTVIGSVARYSFQSFSDAILNFFSLNCLIEMLWKPASSPQHTGFIIYLFSTGNSQSWVPLPRQTNDSPTFNICVLANQRQSNKHSPELHLSVCLFDQWQKKLCCLL